MWEAYLDQASEEGGWKFQGPRKCQGCGAQLASRPQTATTFMKTRHLRPFTIGSSHCDLEAFNWDGTIELLSKLCRGHPSKAKLCGSLKNEITYCTVHLEMIYTVVLRVITYQKERGRTPAHSRSLHLVIANPLGRKGWMAWYPSPRRR